MPSPEKLSIYILLNDSISSLYHEFAAKLYIIVHALARRYIYRKTCTRVSVLKNEEKNVNEFIRRTLKKSNWIKPKEEGIYKRVVSNPAALCFRWWNWRYFTAPRVASRARFQSSWRGEVVFKHE